MGSRKESSCFGTRLPQLKGSDRPRPRAGGNRSQRLGDGHRNLPTLVVWLDSKRARQRSGQYPGWGRFSFPEPRDSTPARPGPARRASEQVQSARR